MKIQIQVIALQVQFESLAVLDLKSIFSFVEQKIQLFLQCDILHCNAKIVEPGWPNILA